MLSPNTSLKSLATKLDKIIDKNATHELTDDEREAMKEFAKLLVAFSRLRRLAIWILIFVAVVTTNYERIQSFIERVFSGSN